MKEPFKVGDLVRLKDDGSISIYLGLNHRHKTGIRTFHIVYDIFEGKQYGFFYESEIEHYEK